jgi:putative chitinase
LPLAAVDRKRFFDRLRREQGTLRAGQVRALEFLLDQMEADAALTDTRHAAYQLATVAWETARTFEPIDERGGEAYFNKRYGPQTKVGQRLGNMVAGDGARYHGRGYVQLTGRANYERAGRQLGADLVGRPELAKDPATAYRIMSEGMREGWFTGKKLSDYIAGARVDYRNARRIINGLDRADEIAELARDFEAALRAGHEPSRAPLTVLAPSGAIEQAAAVVVAAPAVAAVASVPGGAVTDDPVKANKQSLIRKLINWAGGTTGVGTVVSMGADYLSKMAGLAPETQVLVVQGVFLCVVLFGAIAICAAAFDHFQTKYIRARGDLQNVK